MRRALPLVLMLLVIVTAFSITSIAGLQRTVYGFVYLDGSKIIPDKVTLSIGDQEIDAVIFDDGYYIIDFAEEDGETGIFIVTIDGEDYLANETITLLPDVFDYPMDLHVTMVNHPPIKPYNPYPPDGEADVIINPILSWNCYDPDNDDLTFDIYLGTTPDPPKVSSNQSSTSYSPGPLEYSTTYYWRVVAWDENGLKNESSLWRFTTLSFDNHPPNKPYDPIPTNGSIDVPVNITLSWQCSDPDNDSLRFDVYFGIAFPLDKVSENQTSKNYTPPILEHSTTYYWRVVAWDEHGASAEGDVWSFTTSPKPANHPPDKPSNPSPANNSKDISTDPSLRVLVTDKDGDSMDVYFYDAMSNSLIGVDRNVSNNFVAEIVWHGLEYGRRYSWYVVVNDSRSETTSDIWYFETRKPNPPTVEIVKPVRAIYFMNRKVIGFFFPIVIGHLSIEVDVESEGDVDRVEFFVDNSLKFNDTEKPYAWLWDDRAIGFHTIKIIAYDEYGSRSEASKTILIFNLFKRV